jgi:prepilin peptidase CpaA
MIATVLLFLLVSVATATDLARHKIYNWTTYPGILAALALNVAGAVAGGPDGSSETLNNLMGWVGLGESLSGFLVCGFVMIVCFVFFRVGGGDVKLLAMMGAFLGVERGIESLLWTFVLGGALGLIALVWRVGLWTLIVRVLKQIVWSLRIRSWSPLSIEERQQLQPPLFLAPSALAALIVMRWLPVSMM